MRSIIKQEYSSTMPSKKHRRRNADGGWDPSETDESMTNGHEHTRNISNDTGATSQYINSQGYSFASDQADGGRSNEVNGNHAPQLLQKSILESCTLAIGATMESFQKTQDFSNNLQKLFKQHVSELKSVDETSRKFRELKEECERKDKKLADFKMIINTLTSMQSKERDLVEQEKAQLQKERSELQHLKEEQEERFQLELAEEMKKLEEQHEEHMKQYDEVEKKRKQELEDEIAEKQLALTQKEKDFESQKNRLSSTVLEQDIRIETQATEMEKLKEEYEELRVVKDSFKSEKLTLKVELDAMKKEFALDPPPLEYL
jgi:chromosome segregation ATPase